MAATTWTNNVNPSLNIDGSASVNKEKFTSLLPTIKDNDYASAAFSTAYHQLQPLYASTPQYGVQLPESVAIIAQTQSSSANMHHHATAFPNHPTHFLSRHTTTPKQPSFLLPSVPRRTHP